MNTTSDNNGHPRWPTLPLTAAVFAISVLGGTPSTQAASIIPLGDLPGGMTWSRATGVSASGGVVVGQSDSDSGSRPFRWNGPEGMRVLGNLGSGVTGWASGVSADGSVIIGGYTSGGPTTAVVWSDGGYRTLSGPYRSLANGVSGDGSVIVGEWDFGGLYYDGFRYVEVITSSEAVRWTTAGASGLGDLPGGSSFSGASGVSADGMVIVGQGTSAAGREAFRWSAADGMVGLGDLDGGGFNSSAEAVSGDGLVIVGTGQSANGHEAFRWSATGGMVGLGDLPGGNFQSGALAVSGSGDTIVGFGHSTTGEEAFIWTVGTGMIRLAEALESRGVDLAAAGWSVLVSAECISADGRHVGGRGIRNGNYEAFLVDLGAANQAPVVAHAIPPQLAALGQPYVMTVAANVFADPDGNETLTYSASGLPGWLTFDPGTRTFSGTPTGLASSTITVTATDNGALSASTTFTLTAGFSPNAVVARYNFVASGFSSPAIVPELRGSFTVTFEPISGNGFCISQLDSSVFQLRGQTFSPANTAVVVQNGRRTGVGLANHEGYFTLGGTTSGDAYGITSGVTDFVLQFSDDAGTFFNPTLTISLAGIPGTFVANSVSVTRASAAPVFTAKYAFTASGFSPAGPDSTVAGSFTATFRYTGGNGPTGWVPSILEMINLTINGTPYDPATLDLNVRNVNAGGPHGFTARFELGGRFNAYGGGNNTDDFQLFFTDVGDSIRVPQFVYTTAQALGFHTAENVTVTRVVADPLPGGDIALEQPVDTVIFDGLTAVDFGTASIGDSSIRTFTVRNVGAGPLSGLTATVIGQAAADFSVSVAPGSSVPAGGTLDFTVTFSPGAGGSRTALLRLRSSDPRENPFDVPLIAQGVAPEIAVEQPLGTSLLNGENTVSFGSAHLGAPAVVRTFTIRNTGSGSLTLNGVVLVGGEAGDFSVDSGGMPISVAPGGQTTFTVSFVPANEGTRSTMLEIRSNDADEASFGVALVGIGTVNRSPSSIADEIQRTVGATIAKVPVTVLTGNDFDPDGDTLTVTAVGNATPTGASVAIIGNLVIYTAPAANAGNGSFEYTVSDGLSTVTGLVTVFESSGTSGSGLANALSIMPSGADYRVTFVGVPGRNYRVEYTTSAAPPYAWQDFAPPALHTAAPNGVFEHTDVAPGGPLRLYRAVGE